ncbi:DMT family transporter [Imhoffiella purpurea]|uniref:Permease of the drug/metabolite transporter (DMT) superfamily n=1 Tax=Imhoffiella purpurea TaxID=1249627 RepID=W9VJ75_9GAMM|nr:DMT family transporter [Imhoffiella purpurea]EXJ17051.1 Permease of the drug/metabolite transporter (DMT) superfamily [Imhoffiella purpurea]
MSVPAAFIGVVLIWATTPLAIKWSSESGGFLFGVTARMLIGVFVCLVLVALMSRRMRWHRNASLTYVAAGLGIWGAMTSVYWASQFIPSGLVSVLFGLTPIATAVMAALWLGEQALTPSRLLGIGLGIAGLSLILGQGVALGGHALLGIAGVLLSVLIHSGSAVWVKRIGARLHPLETTTGALLIAVPLFVVSWSLFDGQPPAAIGPRAFWSILYLAVLGSVVGFILYYYVLHRMQASRVALVTLITPVLALLLGQMLNDEVLTLRTWIGSAAVLGGLACFEWGETLQRRLIQSCQPPR